MTPAKAQYTMRQPRKCQIAGGVSKRLNWEAWYYVESRGIDILVRKPGVGTVAVKLTKKQLEQALALIRDAKQKESGQ